MSSASDDDRLYAEELEGYCLDEPDRLPHHLLQWIETPAGQEAFSRQKARDSLVHSKLAAGKPLSDTEVSSILAQLAKRAPDLDVMARESHASETGPAIPQGARWGRRAWAAAAAGALIAVSGTVAAWRWWAEPEAASRIGIAQSSLRWGSDAHNFEWRKVTSEVLVESPIPEELDILPLRWTTIKTEWDSATVLYDLSGPEQSLAWLFVISSKQRFDVAPRFSIEPDYGTGRHAVGAMYRDRRLYVLLVEGDAVAYRRQLRRLGPVG